MKNKFFILGWAVFSLFPFISQSDQGLVRDLESRQDEYKKVHKLYEQQIKNFNHIFRKIVKQNQMIEDKIKETRTNESYSKDFNFQNSYNKVYQLDLESLMSSVQRMQQLTTEMTALIPQSEQMANKNQQLRANLESLISQYPTAEQVRQKKQNEMAQKRWDKTKKHFSGQGTPPSLRVNGQVIQFQSGPEEWKRYWKLKKESQMMNRR